MLISAKVGQLERTAEAQRTQRIWLPSSHPPPRWRLRLGGGVKFSVNVYRWYAVNEPQRHREHRESYPPPRTPLNPPATGGRKG
jgi:hypothetical protein